MEPEHGGGNDAERSFRADKQLLEVVTGIVLAQSAQPVPDAPVGQHDFQAEDLVARGAVAQHIDAAGVGREVAADLAAALGGKRKREQPACVGGRFLHRGQHAACLDGHRVIQGIELADPAHARKREHDLAPGPARHRAAGKAGIAALRHERDALARAERDHAGDFGGAGRAYHALGGSRVLPAPVGKVRGGILRVGEDVGSAYNVAQESMQFHP